jgi:hypothetical protein
MCQSLKALSVNFPVSKGINVCDVRGRHLDRFLNGLSGFRSAILFVSNQPGLLNRREEVFFMYNYLQFQTQIIFFVLDNMHA